MSIWEAVTWDVARAGGLTAYLLLTLAVTLGLALSLKLQSPRWPRIINSELHNFLTLLAAIFTGVHVLAVWVDPFTHFGWYEVFVPLASTYRPAWMAFGIVALYLGIAIGISTWLRPRIGYALWRRLHVLTLGVYALVTVHGIFTGSDTGTWWAVALYVASFALVGTLFVRRMRQRPETRETPARPMVRPANPGTAPRRMPATPAGNGMPRQQPGAQQMPPRYLLWHDYRRDYRRDARETGWRGWLLPAALVATAITQAVILADYTGWNAWMAPLLLVGSLLLTGVLVWLRLARRRTAGAAELAPQRTRLAGWAHVPLLATASAVALLLTGPATWVGVSLASGASAGLPSAGPTASVAASGGGFAGGPPGGPNGFPGGARPGRPPLGAAGGFPPGAPPRGAGGAGDAAPGLTAGGGGQSLQVDSNLVAYLEAHQGTATYLFATLSSQTAAPYIIATGRPVMALGGFNGSDSILTLDKLKALIRAGTVRYFLFAGGGGGPGGAGGSGNMQLVQWVETHCTPVSASAYGGTAAGGQLYVCTSATLSAAGA